MGKLKSTPIYVDISCHVIATAIASWVIYTVYGDFYHILFFVAGAIFIDLDHFVDHFLYYGFNGLRLKEFFRRGFLLSGKVYILLHSWELCIIAAILGAAFDNLNFIFLSLGMFIHLVIDLFTSKNLFLNSLVYRAGKPNERNPRAAFAVPGG
ncbi:hypothetical protein ACFL2W_00445 [Candidatus Omnitrophota bacterium]